MARPAASEDPVLDAARDVILAVGVRRTTVSDVARRAGLSRMTVYRRYPDGAALLRALMMREFGGLLDKVRRDVGSRPTHREQLVARAVKTVELLADHPLMRRLVEVDPELLLPYVTVEIGRFQHLAREVIAEGVAEGQGDGSVRAGDPQRLAAIIETTTRGFVLALPSLGRRERAATLAELERMIDAYLRRDSGR
jgi:AcrR family transcriptional regulator